jgi:hypothetical protein
VTAPRGRELRRRREALGLGLDALAEATGIDASYLEALEAEQARAIPPGYAARYAVVVDRHLSRCERHGTGFVQAASDPGTLARVPTGPIPTPEGLDAGPAPETEVRTRPVPQAEETPALSLETVRRLAMGFSVLFALVFVWQLTDEVRRTAAAPPPPGPEPIAVKMKLKRNARIRVSVDGVERENRIFAGANEVTFVGRREVALDVPDIGVVQLWMDGRPIRPRGRTGRARTLRFVADDGEGGWTSVR